MPMPLCRAKFTSSGLSSSLPASSNAGGAPCSATLRKASPSHTNRVQCLQVHERGRRCAAGACTTTAYRLGGPAGLCRGRGGDDDKGQDGEGAQRARRERPRRRRSAEQRYELAALHSITSSAMESTSAEMVRPSILAV